MADLNQIRNYRTRTQLVAVAALLPIGMVLLSAMAAPAQPGKAALARVTFVGEESGAITLEEVGKKQRYVILELKGKSKVLVATDQQVSALHDAILHEQRKLTAAFMEEANQLIQKQDHAGLKKAEEAFKEASSDLLTQIGWCAVDGTLTQVDNALRVHGVLRLPAIKSVDKALAKGKAMIEGEATTVGGGGTAGGTTLKSKLAIRNGDSFILVSGKPAEEHAKATGTIRVIGTIHAQDNPPLPMIEAEQIEVVNR